MAVRRWQWAGRAVMASRAMARDIDLLHDRLAPGADRLYALVDLEVWGACNILDLFSNFK